jgi:glycosyltransferase involved in cell wall biosynthesis
VIVPTRNEQSSIERCIESIRRQDYPPDRMEIIIVDGMSDDRSPEILTALANADPRVKLLSNPVRIVPSSLNLAIRAARGDVIARVDAHTTLEPDYLSVGVELLERTGACNVGGPMVSTGGGRVGNAIAAAMRSRLGIGAYFHFATEESDCDTVYMGMWPRQVFEEVGLFDEELVRNQDDEHSYRLRKNGGRVIVSPRMRSSYQNRNSWRKLASQFFQYGLWKVRVLQKHPAQMSVRHFVTPAFILVVVAGLALSPWYGAAGLCAAAAVLVYLGALTVAGCAQGGGFGHALRSAAAMLVIHQAWGFGFLVGLSRFARRWFMPETAAQLLERRPGERALLREGV